MMKFLLLAVSADALLLGTPANGMRAAVSMPMHVKMSSYGASSHARLTQCSVAHPRPLPSCAEEYLKSRGGGAPPAAPPAAPAAPPAAPPPAAPAPPAAAAKPKEISPWDTDMAICELVVDGVKKKYRLTQ